MSGLCALCLLLYRLDDRVDHLVTPGSFRRSLVSLPSDGSAPGTVDLGRLFGLLHLFELAHLLELVRLIVRLRSVQIAMLLGPRISTHTDRTLAVRPPAPPHKRRPATT